MRSHRLIQIIVSACLLTIASSAMAQGILLPPDREDGGPLELRSHEVEFRVEEQAAVTKVTHTFYNPQRRQVEGMFYFPIPEGAATTDFAMWMNGERVEGSVLPKDEARQTYERIVRRLRDPGLLEYVNGTLFQARIFPIPARGEQTVEIEYATTLERDGNVIHFQYPVHADSNFVATNFVVNGSVRHSGGIAQVYSPHYNVETDRRSADRVNVSAELSREQLTNDFELFITSSQEEIAMSVLSWDGNESDDQGYFMMSLTPSEELKELQRLPREVTFVVDTSGSMAGDKMRQARELLEYCISELQPEDRFNIVTFSSGVDALFDEIQPANHESKERAQRFIRNLDAAGGTNINGAMESAMRYASSPSHAGSVFFVTDGIPTSGERDVSKILENVASSFEDDNRRLFSFGVGYDVNTRLLDGMARRGTGRSDYVRPNQNLRAAIGSFFDSVSAPLLTNVELDFGDADVFRVYPEEPSVLYEGDELVLFGRYSAPISTLVTLRGQAGNEPWSDEYTAAFGQAETGGDRSFIGNLWASRRVASLLQDIDENGENEESVQAVVQLATRWNIVTPYTSYLAVDPSEGAQPPVRPDEPQPVGSRRSRSAAPTADSAPARADFGTLGRGGSAVGASSGPAQRPQAQSSREAAVDRSIAMNNLEEAESMADREESISSNRRTIEGRTFERRGAIWIESGVSDSPDRVITYLSDEYFALLQQHPEVRRFLSLGEHVRLEVGGEVIEIQPDN